MLYFVCEFPYRQIEKKKNALLNFPFNIPFPFVVIASQPLPTPSGGLGKTLLILMACILGKFFD